MKKFYAIVLIIILLSGCKLFREVDKKSSDSTVVKKDIQSSAKVDTSQTKTETASTKETVYYPQPIYIQGKDGETKVVFVPQSTKETGTKKEESNNAIFETWQRNFMDSINLINKSKQTETKGSVLDFWQIFGLGLVGLIVLYLIGKGIIKKPV